MVKRVLLVLAIVVVAASTLVTVMLLPAHRQIRAVGVVIPTQAEVDAAFAGTDGSGPVDIRYINTATQRGPGLTLSHTVAVLRWADGSLFLIDAGMDHQAAVEFSETIELLTGADEVQTFGPVESQMGDGIQAVRGIGFTHLHIDHASGVTAVCDALGRPAVIYQTREQATLQNLHTEQGQRLIEAAACDRRVLEGSSIRPVEGFPGLQVIAAGGHTPGSTIFLTRVRGETWVFSGDLTNSLADAVEDREKGWIYSYLVVPEDVDRLARWRRWLRTVSDIGAHVVVAHDLRSYQHSGVGPW